MKKELITRDSKGVIRYIKIDVTLDNNIYVINRASGMLGGKEVTQPSLTILKGKAKRTVKEQMALDLNAIVPKYKAKGYKALSDCTTHSLDNLTHK